MSRVGNYGQEGPGPARPPFVGCVYVSARSSSGREWEVIANLNAPFTSFTSWRLRPLGDDVVEGDGGKVTLYRFTGDRPTGWCGVFGDGKALERSKLPYEVRDFIPADQYERELEEVLIRKVAQAREDLARELERLAEETNISAKRIGLREAAQLVRTYEARSETSGQWQGGVRSIVRSTDELRDERKWRPVRTTARAEHSIPDFMLVS